MKYPSSSDFTENFSENELEQMAKQARTAAELHFDWSEDMKNAFAYATYQFFGYHKLFEKYQQQSETLATQLEQSQTSKNKQSYLNAQYDALKQKFDSVQFKNMQLTAQVNSLTEQLEELQENSVPAELPPVYDQFQQLQSEYQQLCSQFESFQQKFSAFEAEHVPPQEDEPIQLPPQTSDWLLEQLQEADDLQEPEGIEELNRLDIDSAFAENGDETL